MSVAFDSQSLIVRGGQDLICPLPTNKVRLTVEGGPLVASKKIF